MYYYFWLIPNFTSGRVKIIQIIQIIQKLISGGKIHKKEKKKLKTFVLSEKKKEYLNV